MLLKKYLGFSIQFYVPYFREQFPSLNSFRTFMHCDQRSQYIRPNSKKNSFRGNYSRKYGILVMRARSKPNTQARIGYQYPMILVKTNVLERIDLYLSSSLLTEEEVGASNMYLKPQGESGNLGMTIFSSFGRPQSWCQGFLGPPISLSMSVWGYVSKLSCG